MRAKRKKVRKTSNTVYFPHMGTVKEAAAASGLAVYRVRQLVAAGKVKHINAGRRILINLDSLAQYMEQGEPQEQTNPGGMWRIPE